MALAVSIRIDFTDSKGKSSFTKVRVPNGFSISDYLEFAEAISQLMTNMSVAQVTSASVSVALDLSGATIRAVATNVADVAQKAFFQFSSALAGFRKRMRIPTLDETKVPVGTSSIDQADVDVAAFITAMEDGIVTTGGTIDPVDARGNDLVSVSIAEEVFRGT